jgi:hypothetical protein
MGATCFANGSIVADAASYLLPDQRSGTLQALPCSSSACVQAVRCMESGSYAEVDGELPIIAASGLPVVNCCGPGRYPAYVAANVSTDGQQASALQATRGFNLLCAACLPGHSTVNGRCIPCDSPRYGAIAGVAVLAVLLIWLHSDCLTTGRALPHCSSRRALCSSRCCSWRRSPCPHYWAYSTSPCWATTSAVVGQPRVRLRVTAQSTATLGCVCCLWTTRAV